MLDLSQRWPLTLDSRGWLLAGLAFLAVLYAVYWIDIPISLWAQDLPEPLRAFFAVVTELGESTWILVPALLLLLLCAFGALIVPGVERKRALRQLTGIWAFVFVGVGLPGLATAVAKRLIGRARPELLEDPSLPPFMTNLLDHTYQSFPSGHATTAFALSFVVSFLAPRWLPWAMVFGVMVGFSRVVVGAHFVTDALSGMAVGVLGAYLVRNAFAARGWVFRVRPDGSVVRGELSHLRRLMRRR